MTGYIERFNVPTFQHFNGGNMNELSTLSGILILATLVEALVEYLIKPLFGLPIAASLTAGEEAADPVSDLLVRYSAAAIGVLLCLAYRADLLVLANLVAPVPWIGFVITGILIGRGANFIHDLASRLIVRQP
jgi:hypothetical protein